MGMCIHCEERLATSEDGLCDSCWIICDSLCDPEGPFCSECGGPGHDGSWPTYVERQEEEEAQKAAADEAKRIAGVARMEALLATAELAGRLGFDVRFADWGIYIEDAFLSYFVNGGMVPEALFLRALEMLDERETPDA